MPLLPPIVPSEIQTKRARKACALAQWFSVALLKMMLFCLCVDTRYFCNT